MKTHKILAYSANLIVICFLLYITKVKNDSDKSLVIYMLGYFVLFGVNMLIFIFLLIFKSEIKKTYASILLGMLLLLIPLVLILSEL